MSPARRGRYAPSPTGELHLGNASSALLAWLSCRGQGAEFVMRVEDLDRNRVRPGLEEQILADLRWLGLDWDEGPDVGGSRAPYRQSERGELYGSALRRLRRAGHVYPCFCTRRDIAIAASAPQSPGDELRYPGTCRDLAATEVERRIAAGPAPAWRFRVGTGARREFDDLVRGCHRWPGAEPPGDFVVCRADGIPAYQLAVVVDDAAMGIAEVVRGNDLLDSTLRQLVLYDALELEAPVHGHVPLLIGPDGARISKRHGGTTLREMREAGFGATQIVGRLARLLGLRRDSDPVRPGDLLGGFALEALSATSHRIAVDESTWREAPR